jgi:glutamate 5-kinase
MSELHLDDITVVKIGSSTLAHETDLDLEAMGNIVKDVAQLMRDRIANVVMVSSGSVLIGKRRAGGALKGLRTGDAKINQICSTIGQADLIHAYQELFSKEGMDIAQGLITRRDFSIRSCYNSMRDTLLTLLKLRRVPILNDNDLLTDREVSFSDNDQLAAYVSAMLDAQRLIILSDVEGLLDAPPRRGGKVIPRVTDPEEAKKYLWGRRKEQSAGGMPSKIDTAILMGEFGIPMYLVNGKKPGVIGRVMREEEEGTFFALGDRPSSTPLSDVQRWLRTGAISQAKIYVSTVIADLLRHRRRASVLNIGIERVEGSFPEGGIVDVYDEDGIFLGRGQTRMASDELHMCDEQEIDGKKDSPVVIHADKFAAMHSPGGSAQENL